MYKYPHIEDYIEIISGHREPDGSRGGGPFGIMAKPLINLARYDVDVIESLATQSLSKTGYTERQATLAYNLVVKYKRQLVKHELDISPVEAAAVFRLPFRTVDRSQRLWHDDTNLFLKFPFNTELVARIKDYKKSSQGSVTFNNDTKLWMLALTEGNLSWAHTLATSRHFEIAADTHELMQRVLAVESTPHRITLRIDAENGLHLTNAEQSLIDYINTHCGGFADDNLLRLVDYSSVLGYEVSDEIARELIAVNGARCYSLLSNRELKAPDPVDVNAEVNTDLVTSIVEYARTANRWPIYVYEPSGAAARLMPEFRKHFADDEIRALSTMNAGELDSGSSIKLIYVSRILKDWTQPIPLLVSSAGMIIGGEKLLWVQNAQKTIYFAREVFAKKVGVKSTKICKLN
jgi:hypothetical protein